MYQSYERTDDYNFQKFIWWKLIEQKFLSNFT